LRRERRFWPIGQSRSPGNAPGEIQVARFYGFLPENKDLHRNDLQIGGGARLKRA